MQQTEFNNLYDKLQCTAFKLAGRYFSDYSLRLDAVDKAMDKFIDAFMEDESISYRDSINTIKDSIRNSTLTRKLEPVKVKGLPGFHGYMCL